jgi:4-amino-4-deoxy-L-arabinose transferase-like glycosyltransferase
MSSTLSDRHTVPAPSQPLGGQAEAPEVTSRGPVQKVQTWFAPRRRSSLWLLPLLLVAGLVHRINLAGAPQRIDDEGTYTAQAYAVERFGELAHYTYWYDHPPLGWLQIAGWTGLTQAFDRLEPAVLAGREAMLVAHLVSVALLWVLARRYDFGRPAAAAAVLVYALSPLAVQFHRTVYLDNVATPWLLGAFVLALSPRRQLAAFAASAACFAVAVLTKETYLLLLPFLAWQMWRSAHRDTRRYTLAVASSLFVLVGAGYVLFAVINSELLPGTNRVSLLQGIAFQLVERTASGSVFDPDSLSRRNLEIWLRLDPVLPVAATVAALACLWVRRLRPVAAAYLFLVLFMLRPGYLPVPYVIAMLPLAALLVAGAVQSALRSGRRAAAGVAVAAALVSTAVAAPLWFGDLRGLLLADNDRPLQQAQDWVVDNVPTDYRLIVDDAIWVDLIQAGFPRENVIWHYKPDTDPAVARLAPQGWRDYDYVVSTESLRRFSAGPESVLDQAFANSLVVASFGSGVQRVDVRRVASDGVDAAREREAERTQRWADAGSALARNPALQLAPGARDLLTGGRVDSRLLVALAGATATHEIAVADFPAQPGESEESLPRRSMLIDAVDGRRLDEAGAQVEELVRYLQQQTGPYAVQRLELRDGALEVTYDPLPPRRLLAPVPAQ